MATSNLSVTPVYAPRTSGRGPLTGYRAANTLTVQVYDLNKLGETIDAVTAAGGDEIGGVRFSLRDRQAAEDRARADAVARLQAKADLYAKALGHPVRVMRGFQEGGRIDGRVIDGATWDFSAVLGATSPDGRGNAAAYAGYYAGLAPGELTLRVEVSALYELEP